MPNDPSYDALVGLADVHLSHAFDDFSSDPRVPWSKLTGNVPKVRAQVWVDALKKATAHYRRDRAPLVVMRRKGMRLGEIG